MGGCTSKPKTAEYDVVMDGQNPENEDDTDCHELQQKDDSMELLSKTSSADRRSSENSLKSLFAKNESSDALPEGKDVPTLRQILLRTVDTGISTILTLNSSKECTESEAKTNSRDVNVKIATQEKVVRDYKHTNEVALRSSFLWKDASHEESRAENKPKKDPIVEVADASKDDHGGHLLEAETKDFSEGVAHRLGIPSDQRLGSYQALPNDVEKEINDELESCKPKQEGLSSVKSMKEYDMSIDSEGDLSIGMGNLPSNTLQDVIYNTQSSYDDKILAVESLCMEQAIGKSDCLPMQEIKDAIVTDGKSSDLIWGEAHDQGDTIETEGSSDDLHKDKMYSKARDSGRSILSEEEIEGTRNALSFEETQDKRERKNYDFQKEATRDQGNVLDADAHKQEAENYGDELEVDSFKEETENQRTTLEAEGNSNDLLKLETQDKRAEFKAEGRSDYLLKERPQDQGAEVEAEVAQDMGDGLKAEDRTKEDTEDQPAAEGSSGNLPKKATKDQGGELEAEGKSDDLLKEVKQGQVELEDRREELPKEETRDQEGEQEAEQSQDSPKEETEEQLEADLSTGSLPKGETKQQGEAEGRPKEETRDCEDVSEAEGRNKDLPKEETQHLPKDETKGQAGESEAERSEDLSKEERKDQIVPTVSMLKEEIQDESADLEAENMCGYFLKEETQSQGDQQETEGRESHLPKKEIDGISNDLPIKEGENIGDELGAEYGSNKATQDRLEAENKSGNLPKEKAQDQAEKFKDQREAEGGIEVLPNDEIENKEGESEAEDTSEDLPKEEMQKLLKEKQDESDYSAAKSKHDYLLEDESQDQGDEQDAEGRGDHLPKQELEGRNDVLPSEGTHRSKGGMEDQLEAEESYGNLPKEETQDQAEELEVGKSDDLLREETDNQGEAQGRFEESPKEETQNNEVELEAEVESEYLLRQVMQGLLKETKDDLGDFEGDGNCDHLLKEEMPYPGNDQEAECRDSHLPEDGVDGRSDDFSPEEAQDMGDELEAENRSEARIQEELEAENSSGNLPKEEIQDDLPRESAKNLAELQGGSEDLPNLKMRDQEAECEAKGRNEDLPKEEMQALLTEMQNESGGFGVESKCDYLLKEETLDQEKEENAVVNDVDLPKEEVAGRSDDLHLEEAPNIGDELEAQDISKEETQGQLEAENGSGSLTKEETRNKTTDLEAQSRMDDLLRDETKERQEAKGGRGKLLKVETQDQEAESQAEGRIEYLSKGEMQGHGDLCKEEIASRSDLPIEETQGMGDVLETEDRIKGKIQDEPREAGHSGALPKEATRDCEFEAEGKSDDLTGEETQDQRKREGRSDKLPREQTQDQENKIEAKDRIKVSREKLQGQRDILRAECRSSEPFQGETQDEAEGRSDNMP